MAFQATRVISRTNVSTTTSCERKPSCKQVIVKSATTDIIPNRVITTQNEIDEYAKSVGVKITFSTFGPGYRAVARADHDPEQILGYCEGFVRPGKFSYTEVLLFYTQKSTPQFTSQYCSGKGGKILHVDKCEVWSKALSKARKENPEGFKSGGQVFGVSLLLGYTCMLFAKEKKCNMAEFLAIDDEEYQHKRLVRFFKRAGFKPLRYVGEDVKDIPDRLVWGGCGTLMNQDISILLERWSKVLV